LKWRDRGDPQDALLPFEGHLERSRAGELNAPDVRHDSRARPRCAVRQRLFLADRLHLEVLDNAVGLRMEDDGCQLLDRGGVVEA
jgi:hypothetical protein